MQVKVMSRIYQMSKTEYQGLYRWPVNRCRSGSMQWKNRGMPSSGVTGATALRG